MLFSLKSGLTYNVSGVVFDMYGSNAKRIQEQYLPILKAALHEMKLMPKREFSDVKEFKALFENDQGLIVYSKEQRLQRPNGHEQQKSFYRVKKTLLFANSKRLIHE